MKYFIAGREVSVETMGLVLGVACTVLLGVAAALLAEAWGWWQ